MTWTNITPASPVFIVWDPYVNQPMSLQWDGDHTTWDGKATTWDGGATLWEDRRTTWVD